jgi:hypothetical protein
MSSPFYVMHIILVLEEWLGRQPVIHQQDHHVVACDLRSMRLRLVVLFAPELVLFVPALVRTLSYGPRSLLLPQLPSWQEETT